MSWGADVAADGFAEAEFLFAGAAGGGLVEGLEGGFYFGGCGVGGLVEFKVEARGARGGSEGKAYGS